MLTEAGLPPRYRPALLNAARRGHVATNPGVLLCQVRGPGWQALHLSLHLNQLKAQARDLVCSAPCTFMPRTQPCCGCFVSGPSLQLLRYQSCMEASGLTERQVLTVLGVYPMVLNASPDTLAWHIEELAGMFGAKAPNMIVK